MTEAEWFEQILGVKEIRVDRIDWQEQALHIDYDFCFSLLSEVFGRVKKTMNHSKKNRPISL